MRLLLLPPAGSQLETITQTGAKVVFVDIDPDYYTIDTAKIEKRLLKGPKPLSLSIFTAIHPNMTKIISTAKKYNLKKVIEDCAQSHFAQWQGQNVGTIGDAGTFSFFLVKI